MICGLELTNNKWLKAVYPLDKLRGELTIIGKEASTNKNYGIVFNQLAVKNQNDELVLTLETKVLVKTRVV